MVKHISGCVIIKDNKILLLYKRNKSYYELPGGKVKPGETPEQAAVREANEEIGCDVIIKKDLGMFRFENDGVIISHAFLAEIIKGRPAIKEPEVFDHLRWIPVDNPQQFPLAPNIAHFLSMLSSEVLPDF